MKNIYPILLIFGGKVAYQNNCCNNVLLVLQQSTHSTFSLSEHFQTYFWASQVLDKIHVRTQAELLHNSSFVSSQKKNVEEKFKKL